MCRKPDVGGKDCSGKSSFDQRIERMKISEDGICCPHCNSKNIKTRVPWNCCMPTIEICADCGNEFVIEDDEILYFKKTMT